MATQLLTRLSLIAAAGLIIGATGCASEAPQATSPPAEAPAEIPAETPATPKDDTSSDASSGNRSGVTMLAEASFAGLNGEARWDADTLVVALDGDANEELDASVACGILHGFLEPGENARLEFPNGTVDCPAAS